MSDEKTPPVLPGQLSLKISQEAPDGPPRTRVTSPLRPRQRSNAAEVRAVRHCLMDVCRLLKQEGWVDILEDFDEA